LDYIYADLKLLFVKSVIGAGEFLPGSLFFV